MISQVSPTKLPVIAKNQPTAIQEAKAPEAALDQVLIGQSSPEPESNFMRKLAVGTVAVATAGVVTGGAFAGNAVAGFIVGAGAGAYLGGLGGLKLAGPEMGTGSGFGRAAGAVACGAIGAVVGGVGGAYLAAVAGAPIAGYAAGTAAAAWAGTAIYNHEKSH